jgi:hypothetical protein
MRKVTFNTVLKFMTCIVALTQMPAITAIASESSNTQNNKSLGIGESFGRWPAGSVPWLYNPTGAPAEFSDNAYFLSLVDRAFDEIEAASGLRFVYQGVDTTAVLTNFAMESWHWDGLTSEAPPDRRDQAARVPGRTSSILATANTLMAHFGSITMES